MAKISSHNAGRGKKKAVSSAAGKLVNKKNSVGKARASVLTYSHRTPRQLHASTYMYKPS